MQTIPQYNINKFTCPHCLTVAKQDLFSGNNLNNDRDSIK